MVFSFAIFAIEDLNLLGSYLQVMLGKGVFMDQRFLYYVTHFGVLLVILLVSATPWPYEAFCWFRKRQGLVGWAVSGSVLVGVFLLSVAYIVDGAYNPFLYFRF